MATVTATADRPRLFGARVPRSEDPRLLTGRGIYVADMQLPGLLHVAFRRSNVAHARIRAIDTTAAAAMPGVHRVLTGVEAAQHTQPIVAWSDLTGYKATPQDPLARGAVHFVGEALAAVVATSRYEAEDACEQIEVDYEHLPVVTNVEAAAAPGSPRVHLELADNILLERQFRGGDAEGTLAAAGGVIRETFRSARHFGMPLEGRGVMARYERATGALTVWSSTQVPHLIRTGLAECLGIPEHHIRVVAPDVGGAFGIKGNLFPEEVIVCLLAKLTGRPVKWVEDRVESFVASTHAWDQVHRVEAAYSADGVVTAVRDRILVDVGAYSIYPWTAGIEPLMAGGLLLGPYKVPNYFCDTKAVATHKCPTGPYRGVARPITTFVMERIMDLVAARTGLDPVTVRRRNLIQPADIPFTGPTRVVYDSASFGACLDQVLVTGDYAGFRAKQARARAQGRYIGLGLSVYCELTALGSASPPGPKMAIKACHEGCTLRISPLGKATLYSGTASQGQSLETTLAQVVAGELGLPLNDVTVVLGDTGACSFGFGNFASRSAVIAGGAAMLAARAVKEKALRLAAHLLAADPAHLEIVAGDIYPADAPDRRVTFRQVADLAYFSINKLPPGEEPGLEATRFYDPVKGTFANGAHLVVVEVDPETGKIQILRHVVAEDCGVMINPMVVEGQVYGATAQGIGGALLEELVYDENGQLLTGTLLDFPLITAVEMPPVRIEHVVEPSTITLGGMKGAGEGATLGPPAALANAVADALSPFGVPVSRLPIRPDTIVAAIQSHRSGR